MRSTYWARDRWGEVHTGHVTAGENYIQGIDRWENFIQGMYEYGEKYIRACDRWGEVHTGHVTDGENCIRPCDSMGRST